MTDLSKIATFLFVFIFNFLLIILNSSSLEPSSTLTRKRKRNELDLVLKQKLIADKESGMSFIEVASKYEINERTARNIVKSKETILEGCLKNEMLHMKKRKRVLTGKDALLDEAVIIWFTEQRNRGVPLTRESINIKAQQFARKLKLEKAIPSRWIDSFCTRFQLRSNKAKEPAHVSQKQVLEFILGENEDEKPCHTDEEIIEILRTKHDRSKTSIVIPTTQTPTILSVVEDLVEDDSLEGSKADSLSMVDIEDCDFDCPIETEVDYEEEIELLRVSEAQSTPCTQIKTSDSHPELLKEKIQAAKLDNELRKLEIASKKMDIESKKIDIMYKKLLVRKVQRSRDVESDIDCDPLKVEV